MTHAHVLERTGPSTDRETVTIQDAARLTGVPAHTLRWYERVGLVPDVERCSTGRRRFTRGNLHWIQTLRALRGTGMSVATLRDFTEHRHHGGCSQAVTVVRTHRAQVLALMSLLQQSLQVLDAVEARLQPVRPAVAGVAS